MKFILAVSSILIASVLTWPHVVKGLTCFPHYLISLFSTAIRPHNETEFQGSSQRNQDMTFTFFVAISGHIKWVDCRIMKPCFGFALRNQIK